MMEWFDVYRNVKHKTVSLFVYGVSSLTPPVCGMRHASIDHTTDKYLGGFQPLRREYFKMSVMYLGQSDIVTLQRDSPVTFSWWAMFRNTTADGQQSRICPGHQAFRQATDQPAIGLCLPKRTTIVKSHLMVLVQEAKKKSKRPCRT